MMMLANAVLVFKGPYSNNVGNTSYCQAARQATFLTGDTLQICNFDYDKDPKCSNTSVMTCATYTHDTCVITSGTSLKYLFNSYNPYPSSTADASTDSSSSSMVV
jgi:hypothetical protein